MTFRKNKHWADAQNGRRPTRGGPSLSFCLKKQSTRTSAEGKRMCRQVRQKNKISCGALVCQVNKISKKKKPKSRKNEIRLLDADREALAGASGSEVRCWI